ncbi:SusC/RagA family TonB-linked outer membrane protein [Flavobacterium aquicola]|uniref:TonB-linked SusC/RagA family outer membrane protein n=1 Tax=Flavobacterium aquicola TaxID=1682742 RepID=A0A3E0ECZ2_9FLAO|nr:TonB-dependent receptor [Flavobacterium aquicola]REG96115.1 TonB-linked SusC/RagA family outer membrane protein [Flavobacterium aquicola]
MTNFLITKSKSKYFKNLGYLFLILVFSAAVNAQTTVTGTVSDSSGPIPGVNIIVKGTKTSAVTDFDGGYSLKGVPANGVLVFSFVGYKTKEIVVSDKRKIDVILQENSNDLKEVVVVGYGTMKRGDLTGSVSTVTSKAVSQTVTTSIEQVLQGRAAGVQVSQNSGAPGASSSVNIRGISSINGATQPIYVIDGVIIDGNNGTLNGNPLSVINPSDIISIDILKDASATAIYGSRASGGVIQVTTKRGKKGDLSLNFDSYVGWQEIPKKLQVLNLQEYAYLKNTRSDLGIVEKDANFIRPDLLGEGTDWQNELFNQALMQNYNLSASGGSDKSTYYMGIGYMDQEGIAAGSMFNRFNLTANLDSQVKDYFKVGVNFGLSNTQQNTTINDGALILTALKQTPNVPVRNADGTFDGPDTDQFVQNNPVGLASIRDNYNEGVGMRANTYAEITFTKGLTFKTQYSLDYGFTSAYTFEPSYTFGQIKNDIREGTRTKSNSKNWIWNNVLNYTNSFGKHSINAMAGLEAQENHWESLYGYVSGYLTNTSTDLSMGDPTTARVTNGSGTNSLSSYFSRLFYSYNDKYLLTATIRRDGSSKFAEDNRWGWFPSAAFAWKASNEDFLKENRVINNLKLRLGWGAVGNDKVPLYAYTSTYSSSATANWGTGLLASNTANEKLKWETTYASNIGIDLGLFNNRIELIADVYYKKTDDLINILSLPQYAGVSGQGSTSAPWYNIGSLENKGIEIALNTINIQNKEFSWTSNFIFSLNKNKVLALNTDTGHYDGTVQQGSDVTVVTRTAVGQPISQFYGYKVIGRFEKATDFYYKDASGNVMPTALPKDMKIGENGVWIGDYMFDDANKDGVIDDKDLQYIGNPLPEFTFGITNTFSYKGFDMSIFLDGSYGNDVMNYQRRWLENPRENTNLLDTALGYAQLGLIDPNGPNDYRNVQIVGGDPYMPRIAASSASSASNFRNSDRFVEDGSFVRLKNISVAYNLPSSFVSKIGVAGIKVYSNMQNILTFTKYSGYDPEVGTLNNSALYSGIDNGRYPSPRITTFGVNVKF